jgi:hypothetical protein
MHFGQASRFLVAVPFVLTTLFGSGFAAPCAFATQLSGIGEEYPFSSASKLSVVGFTASVSYVSLAAGKLSMRVLK